MRTSAGNAVAPAPTGVKARAPFFDNLKGILIFLVVFGHFILPVNNTLVVSAIFEFIYLFHMPLFVFITGLFAKSAVRNGRLRVELIAPFVVVASSSRRFYCASTVRRSFSAAAR